MVTSVRFEFLFKFCDREGQSLALVVLFVGELLEVLAQIGRELSFVQLADDDPAELREDVAHPLRQRVDVLEVCECNLLSMFAHEVHSQTEMSVGTAPAYNQQVCVFIAQHFKFGDVVCNLVHFCLTQVNHLVVVFGFGRDGSGFITLFKPTDTVHETFCPGVAQ